MHERLTTWFAAKLPEAGNLEVTGIDRLSVGHSNETVGLTLRWTQGGKPRTREVVLRTRPVGPGLLEPYDLPKQFNVMQSLESSDVPVPKVLWLETDEDVIGRPFYVMERLHGEVYEPRIPEDVLSTPKERVQRMYTDLVHKIAAVHNTDWRVLGLGFLGKGKGHLEREVERWEGEMNRLRLADHPALDRVVDWLRRNIPAPCPRVTLVHGDCKLGNFMFEGEEVVGVLDWEMATVGDPLTDIGWALAMWDPAGAMSADDFLALYEELTGIEVRNRVWYEVLARLKMTVIMLIGFALFENRESDDLRFALMGMAIPGVMQAALAQIGAGEELSMGPLTPDPERVAQGISTLIQDIVLPELSSDAARAQVGAASMLLTLHGASILSIGGGDRTSVGSA
ncbi:phosphotransferase family protein [Amycolatopsis jejuensis]|uniref:phosphotransferase family protein n=1 Tax=Amycolatopsis jejuensis TaxID=330084 RepID=UPI000691B431|nr:phosphotransferase family protein [Amycolatopsis jejuensis]